MRRLAALHPGEIQHILVGTLEPNLKTAKARNLLLRHRVRRHVRTELKPRAVLDDGVRRSVGVEGRTGRVVDAQLTPRDVEGAASALLDHDGACDRDRAHDNVCETREEEGRFSGRGQLDRSVLHVRKDSVIIISVMNRVATRRCTCCCGCFNGGPGRLLRCDSSRCLCLLEAKQLLPARGRAAAGRCLGHVDLLQRVLERRVCPREFTLGEVPAAVLKQLPHAAPRPHARLPIQRLDVWLRRAQRRHILRVVVKVLAEGLGRGDGLDVDGGGFALSDGGLSGLLSSEHTLDYLWHGPRRIGGMRRR
eukprot:PhM_4_TR554/c0_g1_i1/m.21336